MADFSVGNKPPATPSDGHRNHDCEQNMRAECFSSTTLRENAICYENRQLNAEISAPFHKGTKSVPCGMCSALYLLSVGASLRYEIAYAGQPLDAGYDVFGFTLVYSEIRAKSKAC